MLDGAKAVATVATDDIETARRFYSETLGLPQMPTGDDGGLGFVLADGSGVMVYERPNHRPPENTSIHFVVPDVRSTVAGLRSRGVEFEEYDMPGIKTEDGIATDPNGGAMAWFKDPAGNILGLLEMPAA
ncbi:MAG: hypothetical protein QOH61_2524 [Chloroflexota bacterium]|jgi:catechol 2,3-dioxygenase-like lactoylglutathione lyase family enzyme|nr:hypothetical protein [Chloroflexota bacterium]